VRRAVTIALLAMGSLSAAVGQTPPAPPPDIANASLTELRDALARRRTTSVELVRQYLVRIASYEDLLNAAISVNDRALELAATLDRDRAAGRIWGPLHGIPVALKDNIHTLDMRTTGGALAFADLIPPYEATVTRRLREAGAIILAKTQMTELANWVTVGMPTNYNSLTGYGFNPYDPRRDPRLPFADGRPVLATGGSSSGTGTAVGLWAANIGTETSGSILSPANQNMLVAIKPTVGRISRYGIMPITADQDTAGPMTRTVADAALLLGVLEGPDPNDSATGVCAPPPNGDYLAMLDENALRGARIGIPRAFFYDAITAPGSPAPRGGVSAAERRAMSDAIDVLRAAGATVVDPADVPSIVDADRDRNFLAWPICSGLDNGKGRDGSCSTVFKYGMKRDFSAWLASLGDAAPVRSLAELREWNLTHRAAGTLKYGQENLDISDQMDVAADRLRYEADRRRDLLVSAVHGIDEVLGAERLDALLFPGASGAAIAARPGYPTVMVPFAMIPNQPAPPLPAGFSAREAPFGVSFTGTACSEPRLIALAYAFERATQRRTPPQLFR
jgi:amidase